MRILIVGGGIAGLTLAARLRQRGLRPTVIDTISSYGRAGTAITLWPTGSRVLHGLGLWNSFIDTSVPLWRYVVHDRHGEVLRTFDLERLEARNGLPRVTPRAELLAVLESANGGTPVDLETEVQRMRQIGSTVRVRFDDGRERDFDLVVGADGLRSRTREQAELDTAEHRFGWRLWWWWAQRGVTPPGELHETWGLRRIMSAYPTQDRVACFVAIAGSFGGASPSAGTGQWPPSDPRRSDEGWILRTLPDADRVDWLDLVEVTVPQWVRGRIVLLGDAAAGLVPTTGIGASLAMESAAVLDDELVRVDAAHIDIALTRFARRRMPRVDAEQHRARVFGEFMMLQSPIARHCRDLGLRYFPTPVICRELDRWNNIPI
ncbi:FAD-dependent oxidoreductase [Nocardia suismassiliense]|uniref:FAD-dependent oxidoreductase n=1 Tax=Nocardia suismassiliense TaxID=2077092 RepID=UPI00131F11CD|nr:NAD(P)/FAD-dependent oxidoreductase [Nocardia suismassiliense]